MRRISFLAVFAAACLTMSAETVLAQAFPGRHHGGSYGGYDYDDTAIALYSLGSVNRADQARADAFRMQGQQGSQQMSAMQGSIRGAMDSATRQRAQGVFSQQQAGDWWFQVQQQQAAQRRGQSARYADPTAQAVGFEPAANSDTPRAAMDIIKWPVVLCDPCFADQRTEIESPYRRGGVKGLGTPTAADYQNMIQAADQMKETLKDMTADMSAQEYLNTVAFLDKLTAEARERLGKAAAKK